MKILAALLLLATLVSCAGPAPEPIGEAAVVEPGVVCRIGHNGGPAVAERGIGGTGAPAKRQVSDRGIGGTGIVGVVTGFASLCVVGLEVRLDKAVPISINGTAATTGQLRVGQLVVVRASGSVSAPDSVVQVQTIAVRYEVSGPIEAVDIGSGAMMVAGQRVMVQPATWMAARFGVGDWIAVSGLRQSDGTIIASRLDRAPAGALAVRGPVIREHETTRIGGLVLHDAALATVKVGTFVSIVGRYRNGTAEVTSIEADLLLEDPIGYFGIATDQMIVQAFVHVAPGVIKLSNGQQFAAGPAVQGQGKSYRNAIVWLKRTADGSFTATELHYTNYRAQPKDAPSRAGGHATADPVLPPYWPPWPRTDAPPASPADSESGIGLPAFPGDVPTSNAAPPPAEPAADGAVIADREFTLPPGAIRPIKIKVPPCPIITSCVVGAVWPVQLWKAGVQAR
jgi:hypothetical protein